ncbi:helix-turn-helix domain-containing protein [Bacillus sp. FSL K6-3431]|uniref:helix-turn-helix domain-containing protein n=1 Tax=Bacillus sp. FSL K6-3431 TaxID=2921500 RepID=UPI0030FA967A
MEIGHRIISLRESKGWNQRELAKRVNLNASVMNRIESGERPIKDHELAKISDVLEVKSDYLLGRSNNPNMTEDDEFQEFISDPELGRWYKELPKSKEEDLRKLRKMWEIIKSEKD